MPVRLVCLSVASETERMQSTQRSSELRKFIPLRRGCGMRAICVDKLPAEQCSAEDSSYATGGLLQQLEL